MLYIINTTSLTKIAYVCVRLRGGNAETFPTYKLKCIRVCLLSHNARALTTQTSTYTKHTPNNLIKLFQSSISSCGSCVHVHVQYMYIYVLERQTNDISLACSQFIIIYNMRGHIHTNKYTHRLTTKDFTIQEKKNNKSIRIFCRGACGRTGGWLCCAMNFDVFEF